MNKCPQCQSFFPEGHVYCMNDGTTLVSDSGDNDTIAKSVPVSPEVHEESGALIINCSGCGLANKLGSKFCKQCGTGLSIEPVSVPFSVPVESENAGALVPTIHLSKFEQENQSQVAAAPQNEKQKWLLGGLIGGIAIVLVVAGAIWFANNGSKSSVNTRNSNSSGNSGSSDINGSGSSELPLNFSRQFEGTIGRQRCTFELKRNGNELKGTAATTKVDHLYGTIKDSGEFELEGFENDDKLTGKYLGSINGKTVEGNWTTPYGTKSTSFYLTEK